jgi:hypothetical protein
MVPSATNLRTSDSGMNSPANRNISLRTRVNMQALKSSPLRDNDSDYAVAICRESRKVSPGRQPTESELCGSHAAALMTSVSPLCV